MAEKRIANPTALSDDKGLASGEPLAEEAVNRPAARRRRSPAAATLAPELKPAARATQTRRRPRKKPAQTPPVDAPTAPDEEAVPPETLRNELLGELDKLVRRLRSISPGYNPPPFSARGLLELIEQNTDKFPPEVLLGWLGKLRKTLGEDVFDVDTWKGVWYMLNYSVEYQADTIKRRLAGEYETDEWGLDREYLNAVLPFFEFMYRRYWRV